MYRFHARMKDNALESLERGPRCLTPFANPNVDSQDLW
jgi:hypothetical protein